MGRIPATRFFTTRGYATEHSDSESMIFSPRSVATAKNSRGNTAEFQDRSEKHSTSLFVCVAELEQPTK